MRGGMFTLSVLVASCGPPPYAHDLLLQGERLHAAAVGLLQGQLQLGLGVGAAARPAAGIGAPVPAGGAPAERAENVLEAALTAATSAPPGARAALAEAAGAAAGPGRAAEQKLEEVAEAAGREAAGPPAAGSGPESEVELLLARRRPEILAGLPVRAERIVELALLGVFEDLVSLAHLLELLLGLFVVRIQVRVVLAGKLLVGLGDFLLGGLALDPDNVVVVLVFHAHLE